MKCAAVCLSKYWEVLTCMYRRSGNCQNIRLLNFRVVLFSLPLHTGSVASFLLFDVEKFNFVVATKIENFPIYGSEACCSEDNFIEPSTLVPLA